MMSLVTYTFYLDNGGSPAGERDPKFETFIDLDGTVKGEALKLVADTEYPTIVELAGGFYYFSFNWETFTGDAYLVKIKCGKEVDFANPEQRFIIMKLDRNDNLSNVVKTIKTSSNDIVDATGTLLKSVNRLLEIESGTWKIENEEGLWYLNLYPTNNGDDTPIFESNLDTSKPFLRHKLENEVNVSSPNNPFFRLQTLVTDLP
jgi:hypothetical protein